MTLTVAEPAELAAPAGTETGRETAGAETAARTAGATTRLEHVDAMRPVKQLGVVSTHAVLAFGASGAYLVGASIMLLHVSREGFLFVSACMLTYRYYDLKPKDLATYWRRRLLAVGLPYLCWTLVYFFVGLPSYEGSPGSAVLHLLWLALTGYSQLYFLVVLLQFYILFPAVAWLLHRARRHHVAIAVASLVVQFAYTGLAHWRLLPAAFQGTAETREVLSYQLYLLLGALAAVHYEQVHRWLLDHPRLIVTATIVTAVIAEVWYWLAMQHPGVFGSAADAFQPIVVPFNLAAIALIYLGGVVLARPRSSSPVGRLRRATVDNSYAIYLSQVLFLDLLTALGFGRLDRVLPWPVVVLCAVAVVFVAGCLLGGILARTPLSLAFAGRKRVPRAEAVVLEQG